MQTILDSRLNSHFDKLGKLPLSTLASVKGGFCTILPNAMLRAMDLLRGARQCWIIGNGGSASIASHMAEDYTKNGGIPMMAFNDAAMITCFANDLGYEKIFEAAINYYAERMDLVIAISSSGKSPNILNGVTAAKAKGCNVITFSGFKPDNPLRKMGDLNFYVPDESYGNVEICHLSLLHCILDFICEDKK